MATFTAGQKLRASEMNRLAGEGSDGHYRASVAQTLGTGVITTLAFATDVRTSSLITKAVSGVGHSFQVHRGGLWTITAQVRMATGGTGSGHRFCVVSNITSGSSILDTGLVVGNNGNLSLIANGTVWLAEDDVIEAGYYQSSGGNITTEVSGDWVSLRMAWLRD